MTDEKNAATNLKDAMDTFVAEKFAPNSIWYIDTMSKAFELGGELATNQIAHDFIKTLAEGIVGNEDANYVVDFFVEISIEYSNKRRGIISNILMSNVFHI